MVHFGDTRAGVVVTKNTYIGIWAFTQYRNNTSFFIGIYREGQEHWAGMRYLDSQVSDRPETNTK